MRTNMGIKVAKPPFACHISRLGVGVNIFSVVKDECRSLCTAGGFRKFTPEYSYGEQRVNTPYEIWHVDTGRVFAEYRSKNKKIFLGGSYSDLSAGETLPYLAYGLIEKQGQTRGQVTVHAAALTRNGRGVVLLGKACAGKTTLALELCLRHRFKIVANDLSILETRLDTLFAIGGTKHFFVRKGVVKKTHPQLLPYFPNKVEDDDWNTRTSILPVEIGVEVETEQVEVASVFLVRLDHSSAKGVEISQVNKQWARLYLYENLSRYIRRTNLPIFAGSDEQYCLYPPDLDAPELHQKRVAMMEALVSKMQHVSGGFRDVALN